MLAVVFWHRRKNQNPRDQYVNALMDFHKGLKAIKPKLFRFSATFETPGVPWLSSDTETYEDWYIMSKFAGMDALDEAIQNVEPHRHLMKMVGGVKGGFFGLTDGQPKLAQLLQATWYTNTREYPEDEVIKRMGPQTKKADYSLWARAMGAGPVPNCLLSAGPVTLPTSFSSLSQTRKLIWSGV